MESSLVCPRLIISQIELCPGATCNRSIRICSQTASFKHTDISVYTDTIDIHTFIRDKELCEVIRFIYFTNSKAANSVLFQPNFQSLSIFFCPQVMPFCKTHRAFSNLSISLALFFFHFSQHFLYFCLFTYAQRVQRTEGSTWVLKWAFWFPGDLLPPLLQPRSRPRHAVGRCHIPPLRRVTSPPRPAALLLLGVLLCHGKVFQK